jgi:deoxyribonuclease-4
VLIGAHVSTAGGLDKAIERGIETRSDAIQIFNQSPRMWRPTNYSDNECAAFRDGMEGSRMEQAAIHAVYLIHTPTVDPEVRKKSQASLIHSLLLGDRIGAIGVVLHAGSRKDAPMAAALRRSAKMIGRALAESESCPILLENTAGSQGNLGRDFDELEALLDACDGDERIGFCLDCCHLLASGYEIRSEEALGAVVDEFDAKLGLERLACLHVNDSAVPLGGNRDKHANLPEGELGRRGLSVFLSEPRFEGLPALLEVPGPDKHGPDRRQVEIAKRLRRDGLKRRAA